MQSQVMLAAQQHSSPLNAGASPCIPQRLRHSMHCMHHRQRLLQPRCSAVSVPQPLAWREIQQQSGTDVLRDYVIRRGQAPGTAPHPVVPTHCMTAPHWKPVLLWRDTNAWCPFCERVRTRACRSNLSYSAKQLAMLNQQHYAAMGSGNDTLRHAWSRCGWHY